MNRAAALIVAALLVAAAGSPTPQAALVAAQRQAARGDPKSAVGSLEAALAQPRLGISDAAKLRLAASRHSVAAGEHRWAEAHVDELGRLITSLGSQPVFQALLRREAAHIYVQLGDMHRAEPLFAAASRGLAAVAPDAAADCANASGLALIELLRPADAAAAFTWALALPRQGGPLRLRLLLNLASAKLQAGDAAGARIALVTAEATVGADLTARGSAALVRAQLLLHDVKLREAEDILQWLGGAPSSDPGLRGHALSLLATTRFNRGQMPEAAQAGLAAAAAYREGLGEWHPALARTLHLLGTTHGELRDRATATGFFDRATEVSARAFGMYSLQVQATAMEWALLELQSGNVAGAEFRMAGVASALAPPARPDPRTIGFAQIMAGLIAEAQDRPAEAVDSYRAGQRLIAQAGAAGEADLSFSLVRLGRLLTRLQRLDEAAMPLDQAIARYERLGSAATARMADALVARAELRAAHGERREALDQGRLAHALLRGGLNRSEEGGAFRRGARDALAGLARLLVKLDAADPSLGPGVLDEAFEATQAALASRTGEALRQAALRQAAAGGPLAALLRNQSETTDALRQLTVLEAAAAQRGGAEAAREVQRLRALRVVQTGRLASLDTRLEREMPGFGAYARARPVSVREVQGKLAPDDAVIVTLTTPDGLLHWTLTQDAVRAILVPITDATGGVLVHRIRAGVDPRQTPGRHFPPFDVAAAQELHQALIGPAEALLAGKRHLLFVPDGPLQSLPPALLVGGQASDWLVRRFALTVMPSIGALSSGGTDRGSVAPKAFLGIGNPRLSGGGPALWREAVARMLPLQESEQELQRIKGQFPPGDALLLLGDAATKARLADAVPGAYRILDFATHAVMAGQLPGMPEPAIVLTPDESDAAAGLLTASDIAAMRLDADLVVLSACNTAAPDSGPYAEGLSGLARAFLHAGARSLLVSHWEVDNAGTVELTTRFMAAFRAEPSQRKAFALRSAMLALLNGTDRQLYNPSIWAAFVLVGK